MEFTCIKRRGAVSTCVTAPIILPGPTNPCALHTPAPLPTWRPSWASAWTHVASCHMSAPPMCHMRLAWAMRGSATWPECRVTSVLVPHTTPASRATCHSRVLRKNELRNKFDINSVKIQIKIQKNLKCSEIHNS